MIVRLEEHFPDGHWQLMGSPDRRTDLKSNLFYSVTAAKTTAQKLCETHPGLIVRGIVGPIVVGRKAAFVLPEPTTNHRSKKHRGVR